MLSNLVNIAKHFYSPEFSCPEMHPLISPSVHSVAQSGEERICSWGNIASSLLQMFWRTERSALKKEEGTKKIICCVAVGDPRNMARAWNAIDGAIEEQADTSVIHWLMVTMHWMKTHPTIDNLATTWKGSQDSANPPLEAPGLDG